MALNSGNSILDFGLWTLDQTFAPSTYRIDERHTAVHARSDQHDARNRISANGH